MFRIFEGQLINAKGIIEVKEPKKQMSFNDEEIRGIIEYPEGGSCITVHALLVHVPHNVVQITSWLNADTEDTLDDYCSNIQV